MFKSIQSELAALRDQLGPSPLNSAFSGIHHVIYRVQPGHGLSLVKDYMMKTNYTLADAFVHKKSGTVHYVMQLSGNPIGILIEEQQDFSIKYPRLIGLAFKVKDLELTKNVLNNFKVPFAEHALGIVTQGIPGLDDTFTYVDGEGFDWFDSPEYDRKETGINGATASSKYIEKIGGIDHIAYRIRLDGVKTAARNLMQLTGYQFSDCYTIGEENAETMVFRWGDAKPAIVASYGWDKSAVVWQYVEKYGPRVHHTAFYTEEVLDVVDFQMKQHIPFTTEKMIGSKDRGILQIFTTPSPFSHEITEYIERFHGFTGFFDKGNVGDLMKSTRKFNK